MHYTKKTFLFILVLLLSFPSMAQKVDFDKVVTPSEMGTRDFKEYLVQLAWINSPENEVLEFEKDIKELELKREKKDWTKDIRFQINLNETSLKNRDTILLDPTVPSSQIQNTNLFPIFNFNASVNLGTFVNRKNKLGIAEYEIRIAEANVNQKKLKVRMEVLKRYEQYELQVETLKATSKAEDDANSAFALITDLFKADRASAEDYLAASTSYNNAVEKRLKAKAEMNIARLTIEEMIGIPLDEAKRMRK